MIDLPVVSKPVAAAAHPGANSPQRDPGAPADETPFQAVLAQELALAPAGQPPHGLAAHSAGAKGTANLKADDDAPAAAAAGDLLPTPPAAAAIPALPADAGTLPFSSAAAGASAAALPPASGARQAPALDVRRERAGIGPAAAHTEVQLPAAPAADSFAAGKPVPGAAAATRRETAFDALLPEPHKEAMPAALGGSVGAAAAPVAHPAAVVTTRVGDHAWDQALGDRLVWMAGQNHQVAQLHLNPPELGPLQVTLTLNHDQASAQFVSGHALVRDAIEAALPRLREMLADNGIALGNTSVSADAFREQAQQQQQQQHAPRAYPAAGAGANAGAAMDSAGTQLLRAARGLVDTFA